MTDAEGCRDKLVSDGGVVSDIGSEGVRAEQQWQELGIRNDLNLGPVNLSGPLENCLPGEFGVLRRNDPRQAVVFTGKEGVHRRQPHLFVGADVAGQEEIGPLVAALVGKSLDIEREKSVFGLLEPAGAVVGPKSECAPRVRTIDAGTVNKGDDTVDRSARIVRTGAGGRVERRAEKGMWRLPMPKGSKNESPMGTGMGRASRGVPVGTWTMS